MHLDRNFTTDITSIDMFIYCNANVTYLIALNISVVGCAEYTHAQKIGLTNWTWGLGEGMFQL